MPVLILRSGDQTAMLILELNFTTLYFKVQTFIQLRSHSDIKDLIVG